jgi:hypothetical protein
VLSQSCNPYQGVSGRFMWFRGCAAQRIGLAMMDLFGGSRGLAAKLSVPLLHGEGWRWLVGGGVPGKAEHGVQVMFDLCRRPSYAVRCQVMPDCRQVEATVDALRDRYVSSCGSFRRSFDRRQRRMYVFSLGVGVPLQLLPSLVPG